MNLVLVGGQTSTGKTTISRRLGEDLGIRLCLKDDYKEREHFDTLKELPTVRQLYKAEVASWQVLYDTVSEAQTAGEDLLIEGNFTGLQRRQLKRLLHPDTNVVELFFFARGFTIYHLYVARNKTGERHPGHRDGLWYWAPWLEALCAQLGWRWLKPMRLSTAVLQVDTTDFTNVDYQAIRTFVVDQLA
jgi:predicted kinase